MTNLSTSFGFAEDKPSARSAQALPSGTVTFLFTDIEGSTKLAQERPELWESLRERHHAILQSAMDAHNGYVFQIIGDAFCVAFHTAGDALRAAVKSQTDLHNEDWGDTPIKVRMGINTGTAQVSEDTDHSGGYRGYTSMARVQRLMSAAHGGQTLISLATEELVRDDLPENISLRDMGERRFKDLIRSEHIYQLVIPNLPLDFPPIKTLDVYRHNLPVQMTSFIGREKEMSEIKESILAHRLITLTGSGGTGKTRLSLQVAADLLDQFPEGVWFIELAPLTDPDLISQTILFAMGVREQAGRTALQSLTDYVHENNLLIVLDNCEHLIETCAKVTDTLLSNSPALKILASSREALGVKGEMAWHVPSLSLPDIKQLPDIEQLSQCEAVRLFIERATLAQAHYQLTKENSSAIAQICFRLDGIPLAIELAAARVKMLTADQIAKRIDDRFRLLTGGARTALPRQQTLRSMIDWSYNLLSEQEKTLFRRLAVFVGGWTLEAAESVCGGPEGGIESEQVFDSMSQLVNKSLVNAETVGEESRYHRLETIRQYAREKIFETEEAARIRDKHLDYFMRLAEEAEPELTEANQVTWLKRLDEEFDNFRAALEWSLESNSSFPIGENIEKGLRLGSAIWRFCLRYGYAKELVEKLHQLLNHPQAMARTSARAKTLRALSILIVWQDDLAQSRPLAEESLAIYKELGDQNGLAESLYALGVAARMLDDPTALSFLLESLELYRVVKDKTGISEVLIILSMESKDLSQRRMYLEEALALSRERNDVITIAGSLNNLGILAIDLSDFPQARAWLEESLAIQRPLGAPGYVETLRYLSVTAMYEGNYMEARAYCDEALLMSKNAGMTGTFLWALSDLGDIVLREGKWNDARVILVDLMRRYRSLGRTTGMLWLVDGGFASIAAHQNQPERAVRLFAFADTRRKAKNFQLSPVDQVFVDHNLDHAKAQLDDKIVEALWTEGAAMTLEQAIEYALKESHEPTP